jgi:hypothetical protein
VAVAAVAAVAAAMVMNMLADIAAEWPLGPGMVDCTEKLQEGGYTKGILLQEAPDAQVEGRQL